MPGSPPMVTIDAARIKDWASFHDVFAEAFGFPDFYGRNMNAWIDCLSSLDYPDDQLTSVFVETGTVMTLLLENADDFRRQCPEQYAALVECTAFVNWRRVTAGRPPVLALAFPLAGPLALSSQQRRAGTRTSSRRIGRPTRR